MFSLINKRETGVNLRRIMETISELGAPLKHHNRSMPSQKCGGFLVKKKEKVCGYNDLITKSIGKRANFLCMGQ